MKDIAREKKNVIAIIIMLPLISASILASFQSALHARFIIILPTFCPEYFTQLVAIHLAIILQQSFEYKLKILSLHPVFFVNKKSFRVECSE